MVTVERVADGSRLEECLTLARNLDAGFTADGLATMADDLPDQARFVALDDGVVGFVSVADRTPWVSELAWLAVRDDRQGEGIGTRLLEAVYADRAAAGDELLTVKTLAATAESETYARTRSFYEKEGFRHVETVDPYPGWDPGNPCAIYVRPVTDDDRR